MDKALTSVTVGVHRVAKRSKQLDDPDALAAKSSLLSQKLQEVIRRDLDRELRLKRRAEAQALRGESDNR